MAWKNVARSVAGICVVCLLGACTASGQGPAAGSRSETDAASSALKEEAGSAANSASPSVSAAGQSMGSEASSEVIAREALEFVDKLTTADMGIIHWDNEKGNPKASYYTGERRITVTYSGEETSDYTVHTRVPDDADGGPVLKSDMRFLIEHATFGPAGERGESNGSVREGTAVPAADTRLLEGCSDGDGWIITRGWVAYNRNTDVIESFDFTMKKPGATIAARQPDGSTREEVPSCNVVWDFTAANGRVIDKPMPN
ncbi:hypothetical protein ACXITP_00105 [Actinotignum sanguinis]|uniref:Lipoprotein n=2 Tax=Actinomycetaceae TaxID=2049 RepID=A0ABZ0RCJ7_9ACTO|nr:hypothetical protein [Actinotignum sanguinis]WPJ88697.1 hypothetical protein R0V15_07475 [Schaalia turicensis]MDE1553190.1 hypothetical protein [Actinotignum sanguinis]MDE1566401.1 hypothetical protein [Actinotignum sanguinis]MDE1576937.1 hypothetical protein [Actinotignum sanguinis]MDE1641980.1 hypothetical protein [Actinotignum sanguinis]